MIYPKPEGPPNESVREYMFPATFGGYNSEEETRMNYQVCRMNNNTFEQKSNKLYLNGQEIVKGKVVMPILSKHAIMFSVAAFTLGLLIGFTGSLWYLFGAPVW